MNGKLCFTVGSWNTCGLGDSIKCDLVRTDLSLIKPSLLGLKESKLGLLSISKASTFLSPPFVRAFESVDAVGASRGLVSTWDPNLFSLSTVTPSRHNLF
jgi:hypothetical protein